MFEDNAAADSELTDVEEDTGVRIVDEGTVDLLVGVGGIPFYNASAISAVINGVRVPVAEINTLMASKRGIRKKDKIDLMFLIRTEDKLQSMDDKSSKGHTRKAHDESGSQNLYPPITECCKVVSGPTPFLATLHFCVLTILVLHVCADVRLRTHSKRNLLQLASSDQDLSSA